MIAFNWECWPPVDHVRILADERGNNIKIVQVSTGKTFKPDQLKSSDWARIKSKIEFKASEYAKLKIKNNEHTDPSDMPEELHPANEAFGKHYIDGLNKDIGK